MSRCAARGGVAAADERASAWGYDTGFGRVPRAAHHGRHREVAPDRRTETTIPLDTSRHTAETLNCHANDCTSTFPSRERAARVERPNERQLSRVMALGRREPALIGIFIVCSFFIFRNVQPRTTVVLTSSTSPIVPGDASSAGGPSAMQMRVRAPSSSSNAALGPSKPQAAELPNLAPPPPPMVSAAAASVATTPLQEALPPPPPCTSLSCTRKLRNLEPPWVNLSFQPRIDWKAGGIRGDCVVGEIEYISIFYCDPPSKPASGHLPTAHSNWPSEERLELADIHSQALPKASLAELTRLLPNQTLLIMGDSVMEQFYNALQWCVHRRDPTRAHRAAAHVRLLQPYPPADVSHLSLSMLRKEELEAPNDPKFLNFIKTNEYLWKMGKRKMPPKLPQQARTGTRLLFSRQVNYQAEDVAASLATGNVIVVNWGLHYHDMQLCACAARALLKPKTFPHSRC